MRALLILLPLGLASCGPGSPSGAVREQAYQANNLGVARLEQFRYPEAAEAFRQALQRDPSLAIAHVNLSLALMYAQDFQGAAREATEASRLLPSAPQPAYILGLLARAENRTADALRAFERVRQIDAGDVGTSVNLGQMSLEAQQYSQAIATLGPAVAAEPFNVSAAYNLGLSLTRGGQADEGAQMLSRAQALRSTGYAVTYGTGYLEQGRYAEAMVSTGAEPDLVDTGVPANTFAPTSIGPGTGRIAASPFGRQYTAGDLTPAGALALAAGLGGGLALIDIENDGTLDLFAATSEGQRLFRNDGQAAWTDVTAASGLERAPPNTVPVGCVAADYDNDGLADLFVLRYGLSTLYHNDGGGRFSDVTAKAGLPPYPFLPGAASWADVDHDGDLDLVIAGLADIAATRVSAAVRPLAFPRDFAPAPVRLMRNNGDGTFVDHTTAARLEAATHAIAIVPTDFDNRRDVDLLIVNHDAPPVLFQNQRSGTFRDVATDVGLSTIGAGNEVAAIAAADVNHDDFPDFYFAGAGGGAFALSDGRGRFATAPAPDGARTALAAQLLDVDSDGLLDLLTWSADRPQVFRNLGTRWNDVSGSAFPRATGAPPAPTSARGLALADLDGDGQTDLVTGGAGALTFWRSGSAGNGQAARRSFRVGLRGRVSNRLGVGSKIQVRAGSLRARLETSAATPAVAPADVVFGLGTRSGVDAVRVLWPSGVLQAEAADATTVRPSPLVLVIEELDRKPSSCPFLFTWNGERFEFVTDFMGGGEMGAWAGRGIYNMPDPLEYVRIRGDQLRPKDGRLTVKVTSELEEALFVDRVQLLAMAHPSDVTVYPNEGLTSPPKPFRVFAVRDERVPRAIDDHGHDVGDRIAHVDRRYPDDFGLERFRGYAAPHALTLDLGTLGARPVLLLTGWTDYAFSSDNVAAEQAGLSLSPPALQVKDAAGRWRTVISDVGIPVGRPQTVPVDLAGRLRPGEHEVRLVTNMRIYWDRIVVASALPDADLQSTPLDPLSATLGARGFSAEVRPDGREPARYDYGRVSQVSLWTMWKAMPGRYTREGDVRPLLTKADDMFVIAKPGDEMAIDFDATAIAPLPDGWIRTFLLLADGFSKEMDINSGSPDVVGPLPFHGMTRYPYQWPERYPDTAAHRDYQEAYNTRVVVRTVPSLTRLESK